MFEASVTLMFSVNYIVIFKYKMIEVEWDMKASGGEWKVKEKTRKQEVKAGEYKI